MDKINAKVPHAQRQEIALQLTGCPNEAQDGAEILFGIRPEAVADQDSADRAANALVSFPNRIDVVEPAGSDTFVTTTFGKKDVICRMRADTKTRAGDTRDLVFNMEKCVPFDPKDGARIRLV